MQKSIEFHLPHSEILQLSLNRYARIQIQALKTGFMADLHFTPEHFDKGHKSLKLLKNLV